LKKPSSTAASAGKYEFEIMSGTASFMAHPPGQDGRRIGLVNVHAFASFFAASPAQRGKSRSVPRTRERYA
jgi:hypothetical protein